MSENTVFSRFSRVKSLGTLSHSNRAWSEAPSVDISYFWDGSRIPEEIHGLRTTVSSVWSKSSIFFRFECQFDSLTVSPELGSDGPIDQLWEFDVVEVFLRPSGCEDYFEFEASPLGQWLDVHIRHPRVDVDFSWRSEMAVSTRINEAGRIWTSVMEIPFTPIIQSSHLKTPPHTGDIWRLNLFRIVGKPPERQYLSWRPTLTAMPDFHVPSAFGNVIFAED